MFLKSLPVCSLALPIFTSGGREIGAPVGVFEVPRVSLLSSQLFPFCKSYRISRDGGSIPYPHPTAKNPRTPFPDALI